jgi:hypothetical protein
MTRLATPIQWLVKHSSSDESLLLSHDEIDDEEHWFVSWMENHSELGRQ